MGPCYLWDPVIYETLLFMRPCYLWDPVIYETHLYNMALDSQITPCGLIKYLG